MRPLITAVLVSLLCAAGLAVALLTFPAIAGAWGPGSLPPGWTVSHQMQQGATVCPSSYAIVAPAAASPYFCEDSPTYQQDFDAWVDAHYTAPTTAATTTAATTTDTTPVPTTTDATATTAVTTTAAAGTAPAPGPAATTTVTVTDPTVDARLTALEANYVALAKRVDAIAQANTASWDAFIAASNAGASAADAALAARSAGLNAIYQLPPV